MASNLARKSARRKKQTRLTFDPLDGDLYSSSPAKMSPAKIRYTRPNLRSTPSSSRLIYKGEDSGESEDELALSRKGLGDFTSKAGSKQQKKKDGKLPFKALPTPVKSSQAMPNRTTAHDLESDESNFETHHHSQQRRPINALFSSGSRRPRASVVADDSVGSLPESEVNTPTKKAKGKGKAVLQAQAYNEEDMDVTLPDRATRSFRVSKSSSKPATKASSRKVIHIELSSDPESNESDESHEDDVLRAASGTTKRKIPASAEQVTASSGDEEAVRPATSPSRKRQTTVYGEVKGVQDDLSIGMNGRSGETSITIDSDSDDAVVRSSMPKPRANVANGMEDESDEEPITSPLRGKKRKQIVSSDESDVPISPRKRRQPAVNDDESDDSDLPSIRQRSKAKRTATSNSSNRASTPGRITRQSRGRKHRTAKEKQMELLKRKRAGEVIDELSDSSESSSGPKGGVYDTDSDNEILSVFEDESEPEESEPPRQKPQKANKTSEYYLSEDSDFVVDDEDAPIGVPSLGLMDIPLQFRHAAHKPMKEHFKDAIEWMVQRRINPAFARDDEVYLQSFRKLDDMYAGVAKSAIASTQWTAEFTRVLYARPTFVERPCGPDEGFTLDGVPKCDVCNHRNHIPKYAIHLEGKAYHKATLEEVERNSEDEDDNDLDDAQSVDGNGYPLPEAAKEWFSGSVCHHNAQQAHILIHWKYHLNDWVEHQLESEGYFALEKLAERETMKTQKRRELANKLVDQWESNNVIKDLYRDFKEQLSTAVESKQEGTSRFMRFVAGGKN